MVFLAGFAISEAVDCSESRFWRTDAERTIPDMFFPSRVGRQFFDLVNLTRQNLTIVEYGRADEYGDFA